MHAKDDDLHGGQMSSEFKYGKLHAMATIFGQKNHWCKHRMMVTFMEVKGHQKSNVVNYVLRLPYLVKRTADASKEWWWPSWRPRSTEVKYSKQWSLATKLRRTTDACLGWWWCWPSWRSKVNRCQNNKQCSMASKLGQKNQWCKFRMIMTFIEVKGQQRSNMVNNGLFSWA